MTWALVEAALRLGAPVRFYEFTKDGETPIRLAANKTDQVVNSNTFTASSLKAGGIRSGQRLEASDLEIEFPLSNDPGMSGDWTLKIYERHRTDGDAEVVQKGTYYLSSKRTRTSKTELAVVYVFRNLRAYSDRVSMANRCERKCRHAIYTDLCGLTLGDWQLAGTVTSITGRLVTCDFGSPAPSDNYFQHGVLTFAGVEYYIEAHSSSVLTLQTEVAGLSVTDEVLAAPGCMNGSPSLCNSIFGNIENFLGANELPDKNVFGGGDRL